MLWLGTYAAKGGEGLCRVDSTARELRLGTADSRITNASYGIWSAATRTAYLVDEQETGRVTAWTPGDDCWEPRGSCESGGSLPCFLSLSPGGDLLAVANYGDGTVALLDVEPATGSLHGIADLARSSGQGPNRERQDGPHAHCVVFDEGRKRIFHVDLGLDRVFAHAIAGKRFGEAEVAFATPPGAGPRHLLLHPDRCHALLLTELSSELMLLERTPGGFFPIDVVSTLPEDHEGNLGGHLALDPAGRVLVTNRGHNSLVAFRIEAGRLKPDGWTRTGGTSPRHFQVVGGGTMIAHEESGSLALVPLPSLGGDTVGPRVVPAPGAAFVFEVPADQWSQQ